MLSRISNGSSRNLNGVGFLASAGASGIFLDLNRICEVKTYHDEMQSLIEHTWRQLGSLHEICLDLVRTKVAPDRDWEEDASQQSGTVRKPTIFDNPEEHLHHPRFTAT